MSVMILTSLDAAAHTTPAREVQAIIKSIDLKKQTLALTYDHVHGPQVIVWNADTKFLRDMKPASVGELKEGVRVTISYREPLLGKPYAAKVTWAATEGKH